MAQPSDAVQRQSVWLIRILGLMTGAILVPFRYLLPASSFDPIWMRAVLSAIAIGLVLGSFVWTDLEQYARRLSYFLSILITLWMLGLTVSNHLIPEYSTSYFIMLFATIILIRHRAWLYTFIGLNLTIAIFALIWLDAPSFPPLTFLAMVLSIFGIGTAAQWSGLAEYSKSLRQGTQLRSLNQAALASSIEGILVTDTAGNIQECNHVFKDLFSFHAAEDRTLETWLNVIQRAASNPEIVMPWAKLASNATDEDLMVNFRLTNGKYIRLLSKAVAGETGHYGRIWFFKDVTVTELQKLSMEQQQNRLRNQNELLQSLASESAMQTGDLNILAPILSRETAHALQADATAIWLLDASGQHFTCLRRYNLRAGLEETLAPVAVAEHPTFFQMLGNDRILVLREASHNVLGNLKTMDPKRIQMSILVPIRLGGVLHGIFLAEREAKSMDWTLEDQQFLASLGDLLSNALEAHERRKAEQSLSKSAALLQAVLELVGVGILVTRADRTIIDCNKTYLDIFNLSREFAMNGKPDEVIAYCQAQTLKPEAAQAAMKFLTDNPDANRYESLHFKDGRIVERFTEVLRVEGAITGRVWFYRDITERTLAEQKLIASEMRNKAIIDAIPDLILRIDTDGKVLDIEIPDDWKHGDLVLHADGSTLQSLFPAPMVEALQTKAAEALAQQQTMDHEQAIELHNAIRDFEAIIAPSGPNEVLIMLRDVTVRKKTEKELMQRNHELDSFVYRASHDLKAPLNSLMGLIDIVKSESKDEGLNTYLGLMDRSVVKLDTFIRNLTDFSKINRLSIQYQKIDFTALLEEINESLRYMQNAERIHRSIEINQEADFLGDSFHLGIVMSNLISNAIKYFDPKKPHSEAKILIHTNSDFCTIVVEDNGVGIPKTYQDRIYELFFRATNQSFGSGLGLYITRNAVEKMHGTIQMESEEGRGTKFEIRIPNHHAS